MDIERRELKNIEEEYIESTLLGIQELKNNLVTQIAHNFRTPLASVIGFAEMLVDDRPLTDEQRVEYARFIQYEGIRLSKLIDDLIELSLLERGNSAFKIRENVLQEVIADATARIAEFGRVRSVAVKTELPKEPILLRCDGEKLNEAVYQLLHNAVRLTKPDTTVVIRASVDGSVVIISVCDSGPGIQEKELPSLSERFGGKYAPEQDPYGTGVGLAIVRHIIELHTGQIRVESNPSIGSTVIIQVPLNPR